MGDLWDLWDLWDLQAPLGRMNQMDRMDRMDRMGHLDLSDPWALEGKFRKLELELELELALDPSCHKYRKSRRLSSPLCLQVWSGCFPRKRERARTRQR